jgi:hypothetical protein
MKKQRGYIAVISAIIISSILALTVFGSSNSVFIARFGQLDAENKLRSKVLALSCVYEAMYSYAEDATYTPHHQLIDIGTTENGTPEKCSIDEITVRDTNLIIVTHASVFDSYSAIEAQATTRPLLITSFHEITSIPP